MKKFVMWSLIGIVLMMVTACAATKADEPVRVKCPSCGYEFDVERYGR